MVKAISIKLILGFLKKYPNDAELGKAIRAYIEDTYGI